MSPLVWGDYDPPLPPLFANEMMKEAHELK